MKKSNYLVVMVLFTALFSGINTEIFAQKLELGPFLGYETGAKLKTNSGTLKLSSAVNYRGLIDFTGTIIFVIK